MEEKRRRRGRRRALKKSNNPHLAGEEKDIIGWNLYIHPTRSWWIKLLRCGTLMVWEAARTGQDKIFTSQPPREESGTVLFMIVLDG